MKRLALCLFIVVVSVGCAKSEAEIRREQAQAGMNALVDAIMALDPVRLKSVLSKEQVSTVQRRADAAGETFDTTLLLEYEVQKRGLIANFGEAWLVDHVLEVSAVSRFAKDVFEVKISFNGEAEYGKPVYFVEEDGEFHFAGISPPSDPALYAVTGAMFWWNHWKFNNFGVPPYGGWAWGDFYCSNASYPEVSFVARLGRGQSVNPANCFVFEYWYGAKKTWVGLLIPAVSPPGATSTAINNECMYNAIGSDVFLAADGHWQCTFP